MNKPTKPTAATIEATRTAKTEAIAGTKQVFPIVGIGASAGGLEALEIFLRHTPVDSGMAFVIVQHLDPTHAGVLPELLQRATTMPVVQIKDRMKVKTDSVYVIPPNKDLSILHGTLHLLKPFERRGLRLPIDFFLRSLADDQQDLAIGVILSGMGSDGALGLRAIKEKAGLTLAQEPVTAKFDSMPRCVIDADLADLVAPPAELPIKIIEFLRHPQIAGSSKLTEKKNTRSAIEKVIILLRAKTGHDFSLYKGNTIQRRIERRMGIHKINKINDYIRHLQNNPQEIEILFKELLIGVTSFFRDPPAWQELERLLVAKLLTVCTQDRVLRAWSVGCSTGEEAYSLAITFKEAVAQIKSKYELSLQIFATDLDADAIDKARQASYPVNITTDVTEERLQRYFIKEENGGYRIGKEIREMVSFATQNVVMDPPFTRIDILTCRNLLIYLTPELQKKLLPLFHYSLNAGGMLFLGSAESVSAHSDLFEPLSLKLRLFRRLETDRPSAQLIFPDVFSPTVPGGFKTPLPAPLPNNIQLLTDQLLLQHFAPPAVLVNRDGDILYINGRTGKYLEPPAGKVNWNIFAMARDGLRFALEVAFEKALRLTEAVTVTDLKISDGSSDQHVTLTIQGITEPPPLHGTVMIVFHDIAPAQTKAAARGRNKVLRNDEAIDLAQALQKAREDLATTREEMQSSQEELKSANEELQSTNEELQSTNEELTTSREEMQSLNEELQTVNAEQQAKMEEFVRLNSDMRNLLNSTEIITIFLDNKLNIRRFTSGANKLFKLLPGDVGRPLSDIVTALHYPDLMAEAQAVLNTLVFSEKQITAADGRYFTVRIMPYRTMEDVINGVVITFIDITATKALEEELREEIARLKGLKGEGA